MRLELRTSLRKALCVLLGAWPLIVAGSAPDNQKSPAETGRWVMTNEHGPVFFKNNPSSSFSSRGSSTPRTRSSRAAGASGSARSAGPRTRRTAEIHLMQGIRRLTRVSAAPEGTVVSLDDDDLFNHPFLYAVEVGGWDLSNAEAARLREYLDRGGVLMVDDFHGSYEWPGFMVSMSRVYPDRPVVDIPGLGRGVPRALRSRRAPADPGTGLRAARGHVRAGWRTRRTGAASTTSTAASP